MTTTVARRLSLLALPILAAAGIAACGGDDPGEPDEAVREFVTAIAEADGEAACAQISERALAEDVPEGEDCAEFVVASAGEVSEEDREEVANASFEVVEETEETASVTATRESGAEETFELINEDGTWKIDG